MTQELQWAIDEGKVKEYHGSYIIYPRRFSTSTMLEKLLQGLSAEFDFFKIMDTIRADKKIGG
jgi:hypothetical protein